MTQENWGMILVRESYLLQNPLKHPSSETVATVIAHELAHNWFGNLGNYTGHGEKLFLSLQGNCWIFEWLQ